MRVGQNPEKEKSLKLHYKSHRVIIPVFIPENNESYYKQSVEVFTNCVESILKTIDPNHTAISILNNHSNSKVESLIEKYLNLNLIDKHIKYSENKGKVYAVLQEARASYEDFITIADSDVFFLNNWQLEVQKVFNTFPNVGVVGLTPDPNLAFYCNQSLVSSKFFQIKKGKVVSDFDLELFEKGIGNNHFFVSPKKNWKKEQFYLEKRDLKVVIGANHFASTYRKEIFEKLPFDKPIYVFPGGELKFLDTPIDKLGYHRVSLCKAFAYHMGNTIDENVNLEILKNNLLEKNEIVKKKSSINLIPFIFKDYFARIVRKWCLI